MLGRRRPLLRGAIVGGAAYQIGKNKAKSQADEEKQNEQINDMQNAQSQQAIPPQSTPKDEKLEKINQLQKMHDSGALTDDEFAKAKEKIIAQL